MGARAAAITRCGACPAGGMVLDTAISIFSQVVCRTARWRGRVCKNRDQNINAAMQSRCSMSVASESEDQLGQGLIVIGVQRPLVGECKHWPHRFCKSVDLVFIVPPCVQRVGGRSIRNPADCHDRTREQSTGCMLNVRSHLQPHTLGYALRLRASPRRIARSHLSGESDSWLPTKNIGAPKNC